MSLVIRGFQLNIGAVRRIRPVVETAAGECAAAPPVNEQEQERDLKALAVSW
jgi:hypothetical protein